MLKMFDTEDRNVLDKAGSYLASQMFFEAGFVIMMPPVIKSNGPCKGVRKEDIFLCFM